MSDPTLLDRRGGHDDFAQRLQRDSQRFQAGSFKSVIIREQDGETSCQQRG